MRLGWIQKLYEWLKKGNTGMYIDTHTHAHVQMHMQKKDKEKVSLNFFWVKMVGVTSLVFKKKGYFIFVENFILSWI